MAIEQLRRTHSIEEPHFQTLLEIIRSSEFKEAATALGGYDLKDCGQSGSNEGQTSHLELSAQVQLV
jgi:hypothetical protein